MTNGDNLYDPAFLATLLDTPADTDAVAFDFYSRYQRPTGGHACVLGLSAFLGV